MRFWLAVLLCLCAAPAFAQDKAADLKQVESALQDEKATQKNLAEQQAVLQQTVEQTQNTLIGLTADIQRSEKAILDLHTQQTATQNSIDLVHGKLDGQRQSLAQVILALQRLSRMPPQALLLRPSAPIDAARAHVLLETVLPTLSARAAEIKASLAELETLYQEQQQQEKNLAADQAELARKQANLQVALNTRQKTLKDNDARQKQSAAKATELAGKAQDLRDLLEKLARETPPPPPKKTGLLGGLKKIFTTDDAKLTNMPATGRVALHFGEEIPGGGASQGVRILTAANTVVVTPGKGVVRFAGPFRQYKLLTIIQQDDGDITLLGGMQELYTRTGAKVKAGEPIGKLPAAAKIEGDSTPEPSLYYEKRRNGKPIDPLQTGG